MSGKKVLVLGATGAMGQYLVPELAEMGYAVDGVAFDAAQSTLPNVRFLQCNCKEEAVMAELLSHSYDAIVDFMVYPTNELAYFLPNLLDHTGHYLYLSSYRIYADCEHPIRETSPRLIDAPPSALLRNSDDYSIFKARGENVLMHSGKRNWTILRPAITYSKMRYQLVTLEAANTVGRAWAGKTVVVPEETRGKEATMTWAGDAAKMIAALVLNEQALGEAFTVSTAEHHTWGEIAELYRTLCGLKTLWVPKEDYLRILNPDPYYTPARWQLEVDRMYDRVIDNAKVLQTTGMQQEKLMKLYDGLQYEIGRCPRDTQWPVNERMDAYLASHRN